ncbi:L-ascorbate metabolism protein UlaG (beta-lactamase superfamily) [Branchiibius hedensis]|uniref:L-ascorbate metabolism protein UlaG, beta-lactamase superfamily n=1 Tax=Branchiibius hedensis TaxID=672460 RepID=A0A2Y8ZS30_9MICO|nr:MBL fold metallo-hydrolase [Branchiibius hedensis]PWJ25433.1 L-ascorbate metabolism protein UlaG (beta-lactamase superfamily) [Branchiibius hedensis]SSA34246.1 L-ascorbate metabolism protein UlaG, beta-lactamase superfamily [Branchiibius hedensis]
MELTHLGHAAVLIDTGSTRVLVDPGGFSDVSGLADLDAVFVTHQHPDHVTKEQLATLLAANPDVPVYADPQTASQFGEQAAITGWSGGDEPVVVGDLTLTPVGAQHAEIHPYIPRIDNTGLVISGGGVTLFHPGDALDADPGTSIDILAVPVTAPWSAVKDTIAFVRRIQPRLLVPIHDGTASEAGRGMYLNHISSYGLDGGVHLQDFRGQGAVTPELD